MSIADTYANANANTDADTDAYAHRDADAIAIAMPELQLHAGSGDDDGWDDACGRSWLRRLHNGGAAAVLGIDLRRQLRECYGRVERRAGIRDR
jgi:hypothetical protein